MGSPLFDSCELDFKPRAMTPLDALEERLKMMPNEIRDKGHPDDSPIVTPLYPSNWELAEIAPRRLIAADDGDSRPFAPNDTRGGRTRNRRVDPMVLLSPMLGAAPGASKVGTAYPRLVSQGGQP